jgi:hypothetical protein
MTGHMMTWMTRSAAGLALALAACAGDIRPDDFGAGTEPDASTVEPGADAAPPGKVQVADNGDGTSTVTVNATSVTKWIYLDLTDLAQVEPPDPATSADWDLGLQRFHYALDGGISGAGEGSLVVMDGAALPDVTGAPAEGWVTDEPDTTEDKDALPEYAFETAEGGWYDYDPVDHELTPKPRVYVVRGGTGDLFALRIDAYYDGAGSPAWPRFTVKPLPPR